MPEDPEGAISHSRLYSSKRNHNSDALHVAMAVEPGAGRTEVPLSVQGEKRRKCLLSGEISRGTQNDYGETQFVRDLTDDFIARGRQPALGPLQRSD